MSVSNPRRVALFALLGLSLIWSYNWIVMKQVLRDAGPFHFAALRGVLATGVLFAVLLFRRESLRPPPLWPTALVGLAQTTGFQGLVQWALVDGGAGRTALLAYTMPFWVLLLARLWLGERATLRQWLFVVIAAAGLLLVLAPWQSGLHASAALALISGLAWAVGVVVSKRLFSREPVSALRLTAWQMGIGTIGLNLIALFVAERAIEWTPYFCAALAYNAVLASGLAWVLWSVVVQRLPASVAGLTSLAVPLCGAALAWVLLGEQPGPVELAGMLLLGVALFGISRAPRKV